MADDDIDRISEAFTEFCLSTKLSRSRVTEFDVRAYLRCIQLTAVKYDNVECDSIPLITGSIAEFSIEPMLPCFSDVDVMYHHSNQLAIPSGYTPPTQLPGEFGSHVEGYEIIENEFSGYVYLERCCLLSECVDEYNVVQCERLLATNGSSDADDSRHGPALVNEHYMLSFAVGTSAFGICRDDRTHSVDSVYCMRCLWWPPQAADWPTRHRSHGWPDSATINRVVSNGCDVVGVAHPLCRHDEWMRKHQWRLSFSRAEIELLNTWTPVQQIVYHMLRYFMKTERLTDSAADKSKVAILSNYHIKTLVLWACELKSTSWWTDDVNLVRICVELLHTLADRLTDACCQHYFISCCNIFYHLKILVNRQATTNKLLSITRQLFCEWCVNSYLHKCVEQYPVSACSLLQDVSCRTPHDRVHLITCLRNVTSSVAKWRLDMSRTLTVAHIIIFQYKLMGMIFHGPLTVQSCLCCSVQLAKVNHAVYLTSAAAIFLSVANKTMQCLLTDEMLDVLATMCLQSTNVRRCLNARHSSVLSLSQAAILMKVIALSSRSTVQLIEIELAKAYLHRALRCKDSDSAFIYCLANVYLAVLYYCTEQYQIAIGHCALSQVKRIQDHSNCSSHVTQGELLPRIDEKVDCSLGLAVFYQYIRTAALNVEQDKRCVSVFNTELFAHYLHMKFLSVTTHFYLSQVSLADAKWRYQCCFCNSSKLFITDVIVFKFANCTRFLSKQLTMDDTGEIKSLIVYQLDLDTSKLVELLQQSAVEHLSICGDLVVCDLGFLGLGPVSFTWDFKALYMYRYHQYDRCLQLCMRNVCTQIVNRCFTYHLIVFIPEFVQWLDEDFVSLFGLTLLVKPRRTRLNNPVFFFIRQWVLSLYLMTRCQIKLRHSVTSLATTLDYVHFARSDIRMIDRVFKCMADSFARDLGADRLSCTHDWLVLNFVEQMILKYISVSHGR